MVGVAVHCTGTAAGLVGLAAGLSSLLVRRRARAAVRSASRRGGVELPLRCIGLAGSELRSNWLSCMPQMGPVAGLAHAAVVVVDEPPLAVMRPLEGGVVVFAA